MGSLVKLTKSNLTVNGVRRGVYLDAGPWAEGVNPALIKIRPKGSFFPSLFREAFEIENNSDMTTDYFEADCIRLLPGHPLYYRAKQAAA